VRLPLSSRPPRRRAAGDGPQPQTQQFRIYRARLAVPRSRCRTRLPHPDHQGRRPGFRLPGAPLLPLGV